MSETAGAAGIADDTPDDMPDDMPIDVDALKALCGGLNEIDPPAAQPMFRDNIIKSLTSGKDFAPLHIQIARRIGRMLPGMIAAFLIVTALLKYVPIQPASVKSLQPSPDTSITVVKSRNGAISEPDLPALPPAVFAVVPARGGTPSWWRAAKSGSFVHSKPTVSNSTKQGATK